MSQQPFSSNGGFVTPGNVNASIYTSEPNEAVNVQALFDDGSIGSALLLDPNNTLTRLTGYSNQDSNSWTTADWATGVYTTQGGGTIGAVEFTGATTIIDFVNSLPNPEYVFIQVNGGPLLPFGGSGGGATNITFYTDVLPATDPTTVTDFAYYYSVYTSIEIDYDNQVLNITANDADIEIFTGGTNTDISINAARGLGLTGNGSVDIRNDSSTDSINIITDNNSVGYTWSYGNTGILTLPGEGVVQSNDDTIILQSKDTGTGNVYGLRIGTNGGLYFATTEYVNGWLSIENNSGNANITSSISTGGAAGYNLNLKAGAADTFVFNANVGGVLNLVGGTGGFNDDGIGGPGGDVNITAGSPGEAGGLAGNVNITTGTNTWAFNNLGELAVANLTIAATNGIGSQASIVEDNGSLTVLATGTNGLVNIGWSDTTSLGNTAVMWFNEPGNVGNAVIRTGNTAATSYAWAFDNTGNLTLPANTFAVNYANGTPVTLGGGGSGNSISNGTSNVSIPTANGDVSVNAANLTASGNISATGNVTAGYLYGDGSNITGVIASAGNTILNGNSNVSISSANGNITMAVGGNTAATFTEDNVFLNNVRNDTSNVTDIVYYNSSTSEITFGPASGGSYGNTQVGVYLSSGTVATDYLTSGNVSATGDVTGNNLYAVNVISATGNVRGGNINTAGDVSATGNITAAGLGSNLVRRAYGIAGSNTAVTLDNIQAMVGGTPIRLYVNTVTGSLTGTGATQTLTSGTAAVSSWTNVPIGAGAGNAFAMSGALTSNGDTAILNLADQDNGTGMWRITGMIANTTANLYGVTIERLV